MSASSAASVAARGVCTGSGSVPLFCTSAAAAAELLLLLLRLLGPGTLLSDNGSLTGVLGIGLSAGLGVAATLPGVIEPGASVAGLAVPEELTTGPGDNGAAECNGTAVGRTGFAKGSLVGSTAGDININLSVCRLSMQQRHV